MFPGGKPGIGSDNGLGPKPFCEPNTAQLTDAYMRHSPSISYIEMFSWVTISSFLLLLEPEYPGTAHVVTDALAPRHQ